MIGKNQEFPEKETTLYKFIINTHQKIGKEIMITLYNNE